MRAFEMPPHARMSLAQQLLLRALIARFWRTPYAPERLRALGHRAARPLHAAALRPAGLRDVIGEMRAPAIRSKATGSRRISSSASRARQHFAALGIELELRHALEPWHVMGEEGGAAARRATSTRRWSACRSRSPAWRRPLRRHLQRPHLAAAPTGKVGEFVAGVRYRAWNPPSALHPTIGVHAPLMFDLVDTWMKRSLGGCQYHVEHPGGRNPDRYPVNANEAEGRRLARFIPFGHTPGAIDLQPAPANAGFPFTLDLRRS
jgi:uncharacterized protein (DUF2126 family)